MIKIAFICSTTGKSSAVLLDLWGYQTLNGLGTWKNIQGVTDLKEADYFVVIERIQSDLLSKIDISKIIYFQCEPTGLHKDNKALIDKYKDKFFRYFDYTNYRQPTFWWTRTPFIKLSNSGYNVKTKNLSCLMSTKNIKRMPGYTLRLNFLDQFIKKYGEYIDVYGRGTETKKHPAYKGTLNENKLDNSKAFSDYKYTFLCENSSEKNHFSDRINDCILNWSIPIYWGATNIYDYYPKDSLYTIDITKDSIDKLYKLSQKPVTIQNIEALKKARELIMYKYNIWEKIYQTIKENNYE